MWWGGWPTALDTRRSSHNSVRQCRMVTHLYSSTCMQEGVTTRQGGGAVHSERPGLPGGAAAPAASGRAARGAPGGPSRHGIAFLGRLTYLDAKARGDKSMSGRRWPSGVVWGGVLRDPRDMAKAGLLEAQSPVVNVRTRRNDTCNRRRVMPGLEPVGPGNLRDAERRPARAVKEMSGGPTSCSIRTAKTYSHRQLVPPPRSASNASRAASSSMRTPCSARAVARSGSHGDGAGVPARGRGAGLAAATAAR